MKLLGSCASALLVLAGAAGAQQSAPDHDIQNAAKLCDQAEVEARVAHEAGLRAAAEGLVPVLNRLGAKYASLAPNELQAALAARDVLKIEPAALGVCTTMTHLRLRKPLDPKERFALMEVAAEGETGITRFYALPKLAEDAVDADQPGKGQTYARELLQMASQYQQNWNFGNALYYGYFVLGRVALQEENIPLAAKYLLDAATTPGSPQLNSFGPNMTLAKELLAKGQAAVVLQFFTRCGEFWKAGRDKLNQWTTAVRNHEMPDFGANLGY
jgi:hypothetical protein